MGTRYSGSRSSAYWRPEDSARSPENFVGPNGIRPWPSAARPYTYTHARPAFGSGASAVVPATIDRKFGSKGKAHRQDASALMTYFENRAGADKVEALLIDAADAGRPLAISAVNWGEVYYCDLARARRGGRHRQAASDRSASHPGFRCGHGPGQTGRQPQSSAQSSLRRLLRRRPHAIAKGNLSHE